MITIVELTKSYSIHANNTGMIVEIAILHFASLFVDEHYPLSITCKGTASTVRRRTSETDMINVIDLHKRHGSLHVLRGITLSINQGEVAAVISPSGGGESTFLRLLEWAKSIR